ncbi:ubiquitin fusion degradation protein 1 [Gregarina niphandrodes]|uniref:Ubiquitin fusion degradation protein 1 n=1 Tax=Gregarina niphandrodes TaxID=110365 RepID=A0A023B1K5_GRENI|nr:ubiquitin fusion degradation protein 1 [Gregarina niphandrodes]EZG47331.1 ubiquitin fusion degradation protein 1 [Gregarina niphandrodes]|eukprot:XP_011132193.1 ubiquitin fusion degradation protein 1 [Gregarina niphandrodes]
MLSQSFLSGNGPFGGGGGPFGGGGGPFGGGGGPFGGNGPPPPFSGNAGGVLFQRYYEAYSSVRCARRDLDVGNKILLPSSALSALATQEVVWPMLFELSNTDKNKNTHCGVLEFSAEENNCYLPPWMMRNLQLDDGDLLRVTNVSLPKGNFVKIQPVTSDFLNLTNHRAVLENSLSHYACVSIGDRIQIRHDDVDYAVDILDTKPAPAISVIETDIEVDFEAPKDYVEPKPKPQTPPQEEEAEEDEEDEFHPFKGGGWRVDGQAVEQHNVRHQHHPRH